MSEVPFVSMSTVQHIQQATEEINEAVANQRFTLVALSGIESATKDLVAALELAKSRGA